MGKGSSPVIGCIEPNAKLQGGKEDTQHSLVLGRFSCYHRRLILLSWSFTVSHHIRYALVRPLPRSFAMALQQHPPTIPIDVARAHAQHKAYTAALSANVGELLVVPVDEQYPDCCFIEDTAIVVNHHVIISRIGAASRLGESAAVAACFRQLQAREPQFQLHELRAPATLDGGDVLQMGEWVFVGLSQRTNAAAVSQLEAILPGRVIPVPVADGLHMKSLLSALDAHTLIVAEDGQAMAARIIAALPATPRPIAIEVPDPAAANIVRVGSTILIQAGFPRSQHLLEKAATLRGLQVRALDMSELIKADGALTCCSILVS